MAVDPSISLKVQPINLAQVAKTHLQMRQQAQEKQRKDERLAIEKQKAQREEQEFNRKADLRSIANFSESVLGPLYEAKDLDAVGAALEEKIANVGSEKAGALMEVWEAHKKDPKQAFRMINATVQQAKSEKLIPGAGARGSKVKKTKILPGGVAQVVYEDGTTEVLDVTETEKKLITTAEERGAELQGLRSGEREGAKNAQKASMQAFKDLSAVRQSIGLIDEGISALDEGAKAGVIESRLPSVKEASIKLDNVQKRLGLNVIQNTTFGSLSESELKFALEINIPKGLNEKELREYLVKKREAQRKLAEYLDEAAIFLGTPGNNLADWQSLKRQEQKRMQRTEEKPQEQKVQKIGRFTIEAE